MKDTTKLDIGAQIKYWRKQKGMTMEELAEKIGFSGKQAISNLESGRSMPSHETMKAISIALNCDLHIYYTGKG